MSFLTGVFIIILAGMGVGAISEIAKAIAKRGGAGAELALLGPSGCGKTTLLSVLAGAELALLKQQMEENAAALEEAHRTLDDQATQLAELQERVDFAERLLAQARDRASLGTGKPQP